MKIKYKLILVTVILFIITINIVAGIAISQYNSLFMEREINSAKNEMNFIINSIENYAKDLQARGVLYYEENQESQGKLFPYHWIVICDVRNHLSCNC